MLTLLLIGQATAAPLKCKDDDVTCKFINALKNKLEALEHSSRVIRRAWSLADTQSNKVNLEENRSEIDTNIEQLGQNEEVIKNNTAKIEENQAEIESSNFWKPSLNVTM